MNSMRSGLALALACVLSGSGVVAQRRGTTRRAPARARRAPIRTAPVPNAIADERMTGVYLLDPSASADPGEVARRATAGLAPDVQQRLLDDLSARLNAPPQIAIQRRGRTFDIASTRAPRITFEADGQTHEERAADGHTVRTRAVVYGDSLMISSRGSSDDEFSVNFDSVGSGRRLRVTRRIYEPQLSRPIVVQSLYNKTSPVARFSVYGEPAPAPVAVEARNFPPPPPPARSRPQAQPQVSQRPPVIRPREPAPRTAEEAAPFGGFYIGENARFVAVLNDDLSTERTREGDPFTMTVREPAGFEGAVIEGRVARVDRGGPFSGRPTLTLDFQRVVLRDGRAADITGSVEEVRAAGGEDVRVDNEAQGNVEAGGSQSDRTVERAALGAAIGAIIGAVTSGGKGAAIGAAIGAGAGVGSVYVQGRDDLELRRGTEITLRARQR